MTEEWFRTFAKMFHNSSILRFSSSRHPVHGDERSPKASRIVRGVGLSQITFACVRSVLSIFQTFRSLIHVA